MTRTRRLLWISLVLLTCVGCDQVTKVAAKNYLASSPSTSYLSGFFRMQYAENRGAFLSFGSTLSSRTRFWAFSLLAGIALAGTVATMLILRSPNPGGIAGGSLLVAGGVGNLIDRMVNHGGVIDFMNIGFGRLRSGIFNVADMAIMAGAGVLLFVGYRQGKSRRIHS